jgi:hypothetical protein
VGEDYQSGFTAEFYYRVKYCQIIIWVSDPIVIYWGSCSFDSVGAWVEEADGSLALASGCMNWRLASCRRATDGTASLLISGVGPSASMAMAPRGGLRSRGTAFDIGRLLLISSVSSGGSVDVPSNSGRSGKEMDVIEAEAGWPGGTPLDPIIRGRAKRGVWIGSSHCSSCVF